MGQDRPFKRWVRRNKHMFEAQMAVLRTPNYGTCQPAIALFNQLWDLQHKERIRWEYARLLRFRRLAAKRRVNHMTGREYNELIECDACGTPTHRTKLQPIDYDATTGSWGGELCPSCFHAYCVQEASYDLAATEGD